MGRFKYIPLFWTSLGVFLFTFKFYFITSYIGSLWSNFFFIFGILSFIFSFYVKGSQVVLPFAGVLRYRSEERRVGKECRSRWSPYH